MHIRCKNNSLWLPLLREYDRKGVRALVINTFFHLFLKLYFSKLVVDYYLDRCCCGGGCSDLKSFSTHMHFHTYINMYLHKYTCVNMYMCVITPCNAIFSTNFITCPHSVQVFTRNSKRSIQMCCWLPKKGASVQAVKKTG